MNSKPVLIPNQLPQEPPLLPASGSLLLPPPIPQCMFQELRMLNLAQVRPIFTPHTCILLVSEFVSGSLGFDGWNPGEREGGRVLEKKDLISLNSPGKRQRGISDLWQTRDAGGGGSQATALTSLA